MPPMGILTNGDFCLGLVYARLDLLIGFLPGLVSGTLKIRYSLCRAPTCSEMLILLLPDSDVGPPPSFSRSRSNGLAIFPSAFFGSVCST